VALAPVAHLFDAAERTYGVPAGLLRAIAHVETGGTYKTTLTSPKGAMGLMQIMPKTAEGLGISDPYDPTQAVRGAASMLARLHKKFGAWPQAIAAYNWGEGMVGGNETRSPSLDPVAWPSSVQRYVGRVLDLWAQYQPWAPQPVVPQLVEVRSIAARSSGGAGVALAFLLVGIAAAVTAAKR
jgi:soluble lytic murein transglycosylase-like protein